MCGVAMRFPPLSAEVIWPISGTDIESFRCTVAVECGTNSTSFRSPKLAISRHFFRLVNIRPI